MYLTTEKICQNLLIAGFFSEPQVLRIETKHVPKASLPEVVLSDGKFFFFNERLFYFLSVFCT